MMLKNFVLAAILVPSTSASVVPWLVEKVENALNRTFHLSSDIENILSTPPTCYLPLDVMFLQDTTGSFVEDLPIVSDQIPMMVDLILKQNPNSYFGISEFKDKPFFPLGQGPGEYCYRLAGGLKQSSSGTEVVTDYKKLFASGGGDLPEAQFQALISLALDPAVGWRPIAGPSSSASKEDTGKTGARLIIISTDAVPHIAGDMAKYANEPTVPQGLPPNSGNITPGQPNFECENQEYPDPNQVVQRLKEKEIYLAVLTPQIAEPVAAWTWFLTQALGFPSEFLQIIESDSSNLISGVLKALRAVTETVCAQTTLPPTTPAVTTVVAPPTTLLPTTVLPSSAVPTPTTPTLTTPAPTSAVVTTPAPTSAAVTTSVPTSAVVSTPASTSAVVTMPPLTSATVKTTAPTSALVTITTPTPTPTTPMLTTPVPTSASTIRVPTTPTPPPQTLPTIPTGLPPMTTPEVNTPPVCACPCPDQCEPGCEAECRPKLYVKIDGKPEEVVVDYRA